MRGAALLLLGSLLLLGGPAAERAFEAGRYDQAAAEYRRALERRPESARLHYNLGTALLRAGRYGEALQHLARAAVSGEPDIAQPARYNQGNAELEPRFRADASPERDAGLRRAIEHYRGALRLDPADADAKWNLELAQRLLAPPQGGGGGQDDDSAGGGGGGGGDQDARAAPDPAPAPGAGAGAQPRMSQAEAEQLLQRATERDRELQQQKLRRTESPPPAVRDW
jgi:tetratricopeptide (TPR) repeat protein